jgi:hypothetical protein
MAEHVSEHQADEAGQRQSPSAQSAAGRVSQALRERAPQRYFMIEHYGPDGEILEASEGHPIEPGEQEVQALVITCYGFAEPRRDWRERGVIPPRGFHRSLWRE